MLQPNSTQVSAGLPTSQAGEHQNAVIDHGQASHQRNDDSTQMRGISATRLFKGICILSSTITGLGLSTGLFIRHMRKPSQAPSTDRYQPQNILDTKSVNIQCKNQTDIALLFESHQRISNNIEKIILSNIQELTPQNRTDLMRHCFENESENCVTYVCADELENSRCSKNTTLGFFEGKPLVKDEIFICMNKHRLEFTDYKQFLCELDNTIAHEVAHYIGVPIGPDGHRAGDAVYRIGDSARDFCLEGDI